MNEDLSIRLQIGKRIADLRAEKHMTQQDLADAAGITRVHVNRIENGVYSVTYDVLDRIAKAFDKHIEFVDNK